MIKKNYLIVLIGIILLLIIWWGIPTYKKIKIDSMVNNLCKTEGGIWIYETVKLPVNMFSDHGNIQVPNESYKKPTDKFYYVYDNTWIIKENSNNDPNELIVRRGHYKLYRNSDKKLLGESISFTRRGGDPLTWAHPSSHTCIGDFNVVKKVFLRE